MPRKAMKRIPRKDRTPTLQQERFVFEYLRTTDKVEAVKLAGYQVTSDDAARDCASRLLRTPSIYAMLIKEKAKIAEQMGWDAQKTLGYLNLVFMEAMKDRDYSTAVSALDKIAKHYGIYEKHNLQRKYTQEDVEKLKAELEEHGISFDRVNYRSEN